MPTTKETNSSYNEKAKFVQDSTCKKLQKKSNVKHSATHHNIKIGDKGILELHDKEKKYYKQIFKVTEKNGSMVTLEDINGKVLFRKITYY